MRAVTEAADVEVVATVTVTATVPPISGLNTAYAGSQQRAAGGLASGFTNRFGRNLWP